MAGLDLTGIRAREQAASIGPWKSGSVTSGHQPTGEVILARAADAGPGMETLAHFAAPAAVADARFCAHARTDIPELLAEVDRLRAMLAEATR